MKSPNFPLNMTEPSLLEGEQAVLKMTNSYEFPIDWYVDPFHFIRSPWTSDFTFDRRKLHVGQGALCTAVAHLSQHPQGWLVTTIHPCHRTDDQKKLQGTHAPHQTCLFSQWFRIMLMNLGLMILVQVVVPQPESSRTSGDFPNRNTHDG